MGRAHEVRAASMAKTAAAKAKLNSKWSRLIYMAAKGGVPDPDLNQSLKRTIERAKRENNDIGTVFAVKIILIGAGERRECVSLD